MRRSVLAVTLLVLIALAGRRAGRRAAARATPRPPRRPPPSRLRRRPRPPPAPAAGTKMAPGLYDLEDGSVVAVGTVEYRDLEGGFWAVIGGTAGRGGRGRGRRGHRQRRRVRRRVPRQRGSLVRGLRRAGRRRVHAHGRPGDHRDARRARGRGRAGRVAARRSRRTGVAPGTGFGVRNSVAQAVERALLSVTWMRRHREPGALTGPPRCSRARRCSPRSASATAATTGCSTPR